VRYRFFHYRVRCRLRKSPASRRSGIDTMQVSILKGRAQSMAQCSSWIHGMAAKPSGFESFGQKGQGFAAHDFRVVSLQSRLPLTPAPLIARSALKATPDRYQGARCVLTADIVRLRPVSVTAGLVLATAINNASSKPNCARRAPAPSQLKGESLSPFKGESSARAHSAKSASLASSESAWLVTAMVWAPFLRAWRTASTTTNVCPEYEKATATSPFCNSAADISIIQPSSKAEARIPMRKNLKAASRAT